MTILIAKEILACTLSSVKDSITLLNIEGGGGPREDSTGIHYTNSPPLKMNGNETQQLFTLL